jgi:hypothetical protein
MFHFDMETSSQLYTMMENPATRGGGLIARKTRGVRRLLAVEATTTHYFLQNTQ